MSSLPFWETVWVGSFLGARSPAPILCGRGPGDGRGPPRGAWARFSEAPAPLPWRRAGQTRRPTSAALLSFSLTQLTQLRRAGRRRKKRRRRGRSPQKVVRGWGRRPAGRWLDSTGQGNARGTGEMRGAAGGLEGRGHGSRRRRGAPRCSEMLLHSSRCRA